jgi:hypothetical protein
MFCRASDERWLLPEWLRLAEHFPIVAGSTTPAAEMGGLTHILLVGPEIRLQQFFHLAQRLWHGRALQMLVDVRNKRDHRATLWRA